MARAPAARACPTIDTERSQRAELGRPRAKPSSRHPAVGLRAGENPSEDVERGAVVADGGVEGVESSLRYDDRTL